MADPRFPRGWTPTPKMVMKSYYFAIFSQKLYGIERIWTPGRRASVPDAPFLDPLMPWTHHWLSRDCLFGGMDFLVAFFMCSAYFVLRHRQSFVAMANMMSSYSSSKMAHIVNDVKKFKSTMADKIYCVKEPLNFYLRLRNITN